MSRHFDSTENAELRATIDKAKPLLPMPSLMRRLGYDEKHIGKAALCPFHSDEHPSFSVFQGKNGWQHKCHVGCSSGDEIAFLVKHFGISRCEAISRFLDMAGFPAFAPDKSREYPESRAVPVSPVCLVSPVSEGQSVDNGIDVEKELRVLGAQNVCTHAKHAVAKKRFKLARDVKALELKIDRKLTAGELIGVFDEWYQPSGPFIPLADTREEHLAGVSCRA